MAGAGWSIGEELTGHVRERGISLDRLARDTGIPRATLHRWMAGKVTRPYYGENLLNIASVLNLNRVETNRLLFSIQSPLIDTLYKRANPEQQMMSHWMVEARNNLPGMLTSFVGRDQDVLEVAALLARDDIRLLTLVGPGGAGKTRLSIQAAGELHDVFSDGIFFVTLSTVVDADGMFAAIARVLDIRDAPGQSTENRLADYLRQRRILLVLDNVEQLVHAAPEIVTLLEQSQHLTLLATSRAPSRVSVEHVWPVDLFETSATDADLADLEENAAVTLFVHRASAVNPGFQLTSETAPDVAEICTLLEGRPLAIELAAARCQTFTPAELLRRFPGRLDLGADGPRDLPGRQRSLRALIDWSFDLLSPAGQELLPRLSIFSGHWSQDGMEAVCGAASAALPELIDASLVTRLPGGRFAMLETIREYAAERLASTGERDEIGSAFAAYYLRIVRDRSRYIPVSQEFDWLQLMDQEHDNLRSILTQGDPETVFRIAARLWPYWHEYGHYREGLQQLERVLEFDIEPEPFDLGSVLTGAFSLASSVSDIPRARTYGARALEIWRSMDDWHGMALVLGYQASIAYTTSGDAAGFARATELYQQSLAAWQRSEQPLGIAYCLNDMALFATLSGEFSQASELIAQSRAIYEQLQNDRAVARALVDEGLLRMLQQDFPGAIEVLERGIRMSGDLDVFMLLPWAEFYLGTSYCFAGDLERAGLHLTASLQANRENGTPYGMACTLLGFAALFHRQGRHVDAATLCGAVAALLEQTGIAMNPAVHQIYLYESHSVRDAVGDDGFNRAFVAGHDLTVDEMVALALGA